MKKKSWKQRIHAILLVITLVLGMIPTQVFADNTVVLVDEAADLAGTIEAGTTYELTTDITLAAGQQITSLAGVLDGKGHTITLADKPLANNVSGTIQNLGVAGSISVEQFSTNGTIAVTLDGGTIQNCFSVADITSGDFTDVAGMVGTMKNATVKNCYYIGTITVGSYGSVGAVSVYASSGTNIISNCYYTVGETVVYSRTDTCTKTNCEKKSTTDFTEGNVTALLNTGIADTGYIWASDTDNVNNGYPILIVNTGEIAVDKTALSVKLTEANLLDESQFTSESWAEFKTALDTAKTVKENIDATQEQVNTALGNLEAAINGLEKKKQTEPVAPPENEDTIIHITSQADLEGISADDATAYYVLDNDIELDGFYWSFDTLQGVLDGKGHTITFNNSYSGLFATIGSNGVLQNIHFKGTINRDYGACAREIQGAVINCYTEVSGTQAIGFAKRLNGGIISNCYSISDAAAGTILSVANDTYTGTLNNVYWQNGLTQSVDLSQLTLTNNVDSLSADTMKSPDFVVILNENRGAYGTKWGQNDTGYPYFGENKEYTPDEDIELPENTVEVAFTPYDSSTTTIIENQELSVDKNAVDDFKVAGTFTLPGYTVPEGAEIIWSCSLQSSPEVMLVSQEMGELFVYDAGSAVVTATLEKANQSTEVLASVKVTSYASVITEIKLYLGEVDQDIQSAVEIEEGKATVSGSDDKKVFVKAKYEGESIFRTVPSDYFSFEVADPDGAVSHRENSSAFYFTKPGTATLTVTYKEDTNISAKFDVTSEYVAIESVKPGISGTIELHSRNGNSDSGKNFLSTTAGVIVEPANASYAGTFEINSSDSSIGQYVDSMVKGYVPYKAGTVTYTATISDDGTVKTGSETVTYVYKNPLKNVTVKSDAITMKTGETVSAGLVFTGTLNDGHEISESGMNWSYDKTGIVSVNREGGFWKDGTDESAPDKGGYFLSSEYTIRALAEGTVTVTGTPVDTTAGAQPVKFTVTVLPGDIEKADIYAIMNDGIDTAAAYLKKQISSDLIFGYEWNVITLLRAGETIDKAKLQDYYASVIEEVQTWNSNEKPTTIERTALAIAAMGQDITDVGGVDLAELIYNSSKLTNGSNELAYALLALDSVDAKIPANAKWSRDAMVDALLGFQNAETGAFGLYDNKTASLDMTCISVQALAPYKSDVDVAAAIDKALDYLRGAISGNYDFDANSNSTAQVLFALAVLGIDVTDASEGFGNEYFNIVTRLDEYATEDGFAYTMGDKTNAMATYQTMQAFDAYIKAHKEDVSYWDFTGLESDEELKPTPVKLPFVDVPEGYKFYDEIYWAYTNGITNGKTATTFQPAGDCTRGQVVTFLWRANGCPQPKTTVNPFTDVSTTSPFYKAILWAYENGITKGKTATTFQPDVTINREQVVTFLWRANGCPKPKAGNPFTDVENGTHFTDAICWAAEEGITKGKTATTFQPKVTCIREQVAAFLYRTYA